MSDLVAFVNARMDERERNAGDFHHVNCATWEAREGEPRRPCGCGEPERIRREAAAKRRVVEHHDDNHDCPDLSGTGFPYVGCSVIRAYAVADADHTDYRQEWAP